MVQLESCLRRVLCKTRLIFPRINGPIDSISFQEWSIGYVCTKNSEKRGTLSLHRDYVMWHSRCHVRLRKLNPFFFRKNLTCYLKVGGTPLYKPYKYVPPPRRKTQSHHHRLLFILSTKLRAASGIYKYRFTLIRYFKVQVWWWYKILLGMLTWKDYPTSTKWRFILTWMSIQGIGKVAIEAGWP